MVLIITDYTLANSLMREGNGVQNMGPLRAGESTIPPNPAGRQEGGRAENAQSEEYSFKIHYITKAS